MFKMSEQFFAQVFEVGNGVRMVHIAKRCFVKFDTFSASFSSVGEQCLMNTAVVLRFCTLSDGKRNNNKSARKKYKEGARDVEENKENVRKENSLHKYVPTSCRLDQI